MQAAGSKTGFWSTDWWQNYRIKALQDSNKALEDSTILQDNKIKALEDSSILQNNRLKALTAALCLESRGKGSPLPFCF